MSGSFSSTVDGGASGLVTPGFATDKLNADASVVVTVLWLRSGQTIETLHDYTLYLFVVTVCVQDVPC